MKVENRRLVLISSNACHRLEKWIFCCLLLLIIMLYFGYFNKNPTLSTKNGFVPMPNPDFISGEGVILEQDDPRIVDFIWNHKLLEPPSTGEYHLKYPNVNPSTGQGQFIQEVFKNMTNGFFVESGAFDGETFSNTLFLERHLWWKGLLVEVAPTYYAQMKKKNRKAWMSKTCLSIKPYPHLVHFKERGVFGKISNTSEGMVVQCVPLFSLLTAMNVTTVDYFSLDVEGAEFKVLQTIPFDRIFIKTLSVEFAHTKAKDAIREFMESNGFKMVKEHYHNPKNPPSDFLFVHRSLL